MLALTGICGVAAFAISGSKAPLASKTPVSARSQERPAAGRKPLEPVSAASPGIRPEVRPAADRAKEVEALLASGKETELTLAVLAWFRQDAQAARDWLDQREDFGAFQTALKMIAEDLATSGKPEAALKWVPLLADPKLREDTLFSIMAAGRRSGCFAEAELRAADLPPERIEQLLSGVADD